MRPGARARRSSTTSLDYLYVSSSGRACAALLYAAVVLVSWNNGITADISITNRGASSINGGTVAWTWPGDQQAGNAWNATVTRSGIPVTARNVGYNSVIAPGATTGSGFQGGYSGTNTAPGQFTLNGTVRATRNRGTALAGSGRAPPEKVGLMMVRRGSSVGWLRRCRTR